MKNFIIGFVVGAVVAGVGVACADVGVLYDIYNNTFGTTENPIYVEGV